MQIKVTGQHIDVGEALQTHVAEMLAATVDKYFSGAIEANVVLSREGGLIRADVGIHIGKGIQVRAHEQADDAYAAFDVALAHLAKRLRRYKRRLHDHHNTRTSASAVRVPQYVLAPFEAEAEHGGADAGDGPDNPVVVAENHAHIESLTVSEAVMRMDLGDVPVLVFRNAGNGGLNVVYRRPDGNVGWIDTANTHDRPAPGAPARPERR